LNRPARLAFLLYSVAALAFLLDRITKLLAERHLFARPPIELIPGVLQLRYTTNSGGAFGLFPGQPWLFLVATVAVCLAIVLVAARRVTSGGAAVGLGLILGGALGNLTDRLVRVPSLTGGWRGISGRVVDFIDFHIWPVFNLADSAIVIGVLIVALTTIRRRA
jgi:signal peptidase II